MNVVVAGRPALPLGLPALRVAMAAAALAYASGAHLTALPHHAEDSAWVGAAFAAAAALQAVLAAAILLRRRAASTAAVVSSIVLMAAWAASRTVGLPLGFHGGEAEAVGMVDASAVVAELAVVATLVRLGTRTGRVLVTLSLAVVLAAGTVSITDGADRTSPVPVHAGDHSHSHSH